MKISKARLKEIIQEALPKAIIYVACVSPQGQKFEAIVIDASFETLSLLKQHQKIMLLLKEKFDGDVHALTLKTFTPQLWDQQKKNFNVESH